MALTNLTKPRARWATFKLKALNAFTRTILDKFLDEGISVKDFGALGDGTTDDTVAMDRANTYAIATKQNLIIPTGEFVYNGTGLTTDDAINIVGNGANSIIDCSSNTNSGHVIKLNGFRTTVKGLYLKGNRTNPDLHAVSCYYNTETSEVRDMVIEEFHYGIDIDKMWYFSLSNIRFRGSYPTVADLDGAHITIGAVEPASEVNNIVFSRVWMGSNQKNAVVIKGATQNLRFEGCSFETRDTRIVFDTTEANNTTILDSCYIEGSSASTAQVASSVTGRKVLRIQNSLIRMSGTGNLVENLACLFKDCYGNNPNSALGDTASKVTYSGANQMNPKDLFNWGVSGIYDSASDTLNNARLQSEQRRIPAQDYNAVIPTMVHQKAIAGVTPVPVFAVYLPAGTDIRRMRLTVDVSAQCSAPGQWSRVGVEQWSLLTWKGRGTAGGASDGVRAAMIMQDDGGATFLSPTAFTITQDGYDANTDATKYTISYNVSSDTYPADATFEVSGMYMTDAPEERSRAWRIEKL